VGLLGFELLGSAPVAAQPSAPEDDELALVVLRDADASECPDDQDLRDQVSTRVGRDPFDASASTQVLVRFSRTRRGFRAAVTIGREGAVEGERTLDHRDCGELVESTALLMSLLVAATPGPPASTPPEIPARDQAPDAAAQVLPEEPAAPATPAPPATLAPTVPPGPAPQDDEVAEGEPDEVADPLRVEGRAAVGILLGWLPGSSFLVRGGVGLAQRGWSARLEARGALDSTESSPVGTASVSWAGGVITGCGHLDVLALCGHVVLARSAGSGSGVDHPRTDEVFALGLGGSAGLSWAPWPWLRLEAEAELDVPVLVPEAQLAGERVWQASPVAGALSAGVVLGWGG
jgi:hypothetical protein